MTPESEKRLKAIRDFTELGSGFKIAMRDMEIRGIGNLLGTEQHGQMESVGYDMYCRLLDEAAVNAAADVTVDVKVNAYIDGLYIPDESQRLEMYQRIAAIREDAGAEDVLDELVDRFSEPPAETVALVKVARLRALAARCGISSVSEKNGAAVMQVADGVRFDMARLAGALSRHRRRVMFSAGSTPYIQLKPEGELLDDAISFLRDL